MALRSTYLVRWAHLEQQRQQAPLRALLPQASSSSDGSASSNSGDCCMVCSNDGWCDLLQQQCWVCLSSTEAVDTAWIMLKLCCSGATVTLTLPAAAASSPTPMHTWAHAARHWSLQLPCLVHRSPVMCQHQWCTHASVLHNADKVLLHCSLRALAILDVGMLPDSNARSICNHVLLPPVQTCSGPWTGWPVPGPIACCLLLPQPRHLHTSWACWQTPSPSAPAYMSSNVPLLPVQTCPRQCTRWLQR